MNVLKTINDSEGNNIIQILYMNNIKITENPSIKILEKYTKNNFFSLTEISDSIESEDYEDFSYLLDYQEIYIGKEIFLFDRIGIVTEIKESFREEGFYDFCVWSDDNKPSLTKIKYSSHKTTLFKVDSTNIYYVWEDYNYQQSYLYNKYHSYQL